MSVQANGNTQVSSAGAGISAGASASTGSAAGSGGPGAQISSTQAVITVLGVAAAGLLALGYIFRRGGRELAPIRVDAANALNVYFSWLLIDGTLKILAYKYHGHKLAQMYLLVA